MDCDAKALTRMAQRDATTLDTFLHKILDYREQQIWWRRQHLLAVAYGRRRRSQPAAASAGHEQGVKANGQEQKADKKADKADEKADEKEVKVKRKRGHA
jgi:hypothetical protein